MRVLCILISHKQFYSITKTNLKSLLFAMTNGECIKKNFTANRARITAVMLYKRSWKIAGADCSPKRAKTPRIKLSVPLLRIRHVPAPYEVTNVFTGEREIDLVWFELQVRNRQTNRKIIRQARGNLDDKHSRIELPPAVYTPL